MVLVRLPRTLPNRFNALFTFKSSLSDRPDEPFFCNLSKFKVCQKIKLC